MNKNLLALILFTLSGAALAERGLSPLRGTDYLGFSSNQDLGNGLKAIWQVEGRVQLTEQLRLAFGYQLNGQRGDPDRPSADPGLKTRDYVFSAAYRIGLFTPKFSYAPGIGDSDNGWAMGLDYALTKRTRASVSYGSLKFGNGNDAQSEFLGAGSNGARRENGFGIELRHRF